jgi:hypothetical protein
MRAVSAPRGDTTSEGDGAPERASTTPCTSRCQASCARPWAENLVEVKSEVFIG